MSNVFSNQQLNIKSIFDKVRPKVNLDYFNQKDFNETFLISFAETLFVTYRNMTDSKREKLNQITMQSIKETKGKYVSSTKELTNEILDVLEKKQCKLTTMINVLKKTLENY